MTARAFAIVALLAGCDQVFSLDRPAVRDGGGDAHDATTTGCRFEATPPIASAAGATHLVAAHLDDDDAIDLAIASPAFNGVGVLTNRDGAFTGVTLLALEGPVVALVAADLDGAAPHDLLAATAMFMYGYLASGAPAARVALTSGIPSGLATANFDGAGLRDVVVSVPSARHLQLVLGMEASFELGDTTPTAGVPVAVATHDLDGDIDADLLAAFAPENQLATYLDDGNNFTAGRTSALAAAPSSLLVARLGESDQIIMTSEAANEIRIGTYRSDSIELTRIAMDGGPRFALATDLDGDLFPELVVVKSAGALGILQGTASGVGGELVVPTVAKATAVAAGDFNGDGRQDLAVIGAEAGLVIHTAVCQ